MKSKRALITGWMAIGCMTVGAIAIAYGNFVLSTICMTVAYICAVDEVSRCYKTIAMSTKMLKDARDASANILKTVEELQEHAKHRRRR